MTPVAEMDANWWRQACIYQCYPRSFADLNGDGIGDFRGVTDRATYLEELGVEAVWFSPFYPSELKDGGYDVTDYRDVDPRIGTINDFEEMVKTLAQSNIKVLVDIVPNHCCDQHAWFQAALKSPRGSKERARFHFVDGKGKGMEEPPNDWESYFGGSAWEPVGDGQFYLHLYDTAQPDFNWSNQEVREDFLETLRFWTSKGVAGFRIDVALGCMKDMSEPFLPQAKLDELRVKMRGVGFPPNQHPLRDRDAVLDVYREWRREVFDKHDPPLMSVAEAWVAPDRRKLYAAPDVLGQSFAIETLGCAYNSPAWQGVIDLLIAEAKDAGSSPTWTVSNHDFVRHATRYGLPGIEMFTADTTADLTRWPNEYLFSKGESPRCDAELGLRRAKAVSLMLMALPGSLYLYQGEELGLPEVIDIPADKRQDPIYFRNHGRNIGRDGCRVPIPWSKTGTNFGFGSGEPAHLPMPDWMGELSIESQAGVEGSVLEFYKLALRNRKTLLRNAGEDVIWVQRSESLLHFRRGDVEVMMNFGAERTALPKGEIVVCSAALEEGKVGQDTTVWVKVEN